MFKYIQDRIKPKLVFECFDDDGKTPLYVLKRKWWPGEHLYRQIRLFIILCCSWYEGSFIDPQTAYEVVKGIFR